MNNLRLGFTETTLLFFYYVHLFKEECDLNLKLNICLFNCLFSTSGFYDKKVSGTYFDFDKNQIKNSEVYNLYFEKLLQIVKNNNTALQLCFHDTDKNEYNEDFLNYIDYHNKLKHPNMLTFMDNKNVLIINNLGFLMKKQYESGNIKRICPEFSDNIKSIQYLEPGYTFCNNGPDSSILETAEKICNVIKTYEFDGAIISAGAYSPLLFDYIVNHLKKEAFVIGGDLPLYFGITTKRVIFFNKDKINEYFIPVPDEMKPSNYEKVEGGCYW